MFFSSARAPALLITSVSSPPSGVRTLPCVWPNPDGFIEERRGCGWPAHSTLVIFACQSLAVLGTDVDGAWTDGRTASDNCFYFITVGYFLDNSFVDKISRLF